MVNKMSHTTTAGIPVPAKVNYVVDARGSACPGPLLETKKAIGIVPINGTLVIWSSDPGSREDIKVWANFAKHDYLGWVADTGFDRHYLIRKK